jgi:ectoine hydroxylase-related dioxygenase (phytanoyl-CoA dioxygenase family)
MGYESRARITADHVAHWERHGYVVIEDFLSPGELAAAQEAVHRHFPTWEQRAADLSAYEGLGPWREFPFRGPELNHITTHPSLIDFVSSTLGTEDVFVTQSLLWGKYAGGGDWEQSHHMDYGNNTLVVPRDDGQFRQVPMILYYSDVTPDLGPTCVVSQEVSGSEPVWPATFERADHPALYEHEVPVTVPAGSLMIYSMRTVHRGTAMRATTGSRFSHHIVWRRGGFEWMGWRAFPREAKDEDFVAFLEEATPRQRAVLGFPAPGHQYWTESTLRGVAARYPGMDLSEYVSQMPLTSRA